MSASSDILRYGIESILTVAFITVSVFLYRCTERVHASRRLRKANGYFHFALFAVCFGVLAIALKWSLDIGRVQVRTSSDYVIVVLAVVVIAGISLMYAMLGETVGRYLVQSCSYIMHGAPTGPHRAVEVVLTLMFTLVDLVVFAFITASLTSTVFVLLRLTL